MMIDIDDLLPLPTEPLGKVLMPWWLKPLLLLIVLAVFGWWAYDYGVDAERARWQAVENEKIIAANTKILALQNEKYDLEQKRVADVANRTAQLKKEMKDHAEKANAVLAAVRADNLRLRVKAMRTAGGDGSTGQTCATVAGADNAGAPGLSGEPAGVFVELTPEYAGYFIGRASRADQLALKFNKCIEQLAADRASNLTQGDSHETD